MVLERRTEKQERARCLCKEFGLSVSYKAIGKSYTWEDDLICFIIRAVVWRMDPGGRRRRYQEWKQRDQLGGSGHGLPWRCRCLRWRYQKRRWWKMYSGHRYKRSGCWSKCGRWEREQLRDSEISGHMGAFYGNGEHQKEAGIVWGDVGRKLCSGQVIFEILTQHSQTDKIWMSLEIRLGINFHVEGHMPWVTWDHLTRICS